MKTINFRGNRLFSMMNKNQSRYEGIIDESPKTEYNRRKNSLNDYSFRQLYDYTKHTRLNFENNSNTRELTDEAENLGGNGSGGTGIVPIGNDDHFMVTANTTLTIDAANGILANDYAPSNPLTVISYYNVSHGNITLYTSGRFNYTPNPGYIGTDSFRYNFTDGTSTFSADVTLNITNPSIEPFNIDIDFIDNSLTSSQKALFTSAANRWSEIITHDIPDMNIGGQLIDDLLIKASAANIDGVSGILANGRPTSVRSSSYLPVLGEMKIDTSDINNLESNGILDDVILHEMGHTLGLGSKTIWNHFSLVTGRGTSNPRFTGAQAIDQYNDLFGINATSVPLGTSCSHWRDSVFPNEIMTEAPVLGDNAISSVTVGALADMGYEVNFAAADNFVV